MSLDAVATKKDLDVLYVRIEKMVGSVVGEIVSDALHLISKRFDQVDKRFERVEGDIVEMKTDIRETKTDIQEMKADIKDLTVITMRIDNRLDDNIETTELHTAQIRQLRRKIA